MDLDDSLCEYLTHEYLEGSKPHVCSVLLAALSYMRPELGRPKEMAVPRCK